MAITEKTPARDKWSNRAEFFLTLVAYSVGTGNILRFPYLCMRYQGGAFLVAYFTCLLLCGCPLFILEIAMGQSTQRSCLGCWDRYGTLFRGLAYTMLLSSTVVAFYTSTYMSWFLFYFVKSLASQLPWSSSSDLLMSNGTGLRNNTTDDVINVSSNVTYVERGINGTSMASTEDYFQNTVLQLSSGIGELGHLRWELCLAHLATWLIMSLCVIQGIKTAGKVVWITALLPYVILTVFVIRAALLPGFMEGIHFYLTPKFDQLLNPEVWIMAFLQVFWSLGPGWGVVITMSSFNDFNHNFLIEGFACPAICSLTSFFAGFATFGVAGYLSRQQGLPVEETLKTGPGIAFITYPELVTHLPGGPFWSAFFFLMMVLVLVDSLLIVIETEVTAILELGKFGNAKRKYVLLIYAVIHALLGLVFYFQAGMYIFQLIDWYCFVLSVFLSASGECLSIVWVYGYRRFYNDICQMIGPSFVIKLLIPLWGFVIPVILLIGMCWSLVTLSKPSYGDYLFPDWSAIIGWVLAFLLAAPAIVCPLVQVLKSKGSFKERMKVLLKPKNETETEDKAAEIQEMSKLCQIPEAI